MTTQRIANYGFAFPTSDEKLLNSPLTIVAGGSGLKIATGRPNLSEAKTVESDINAFCSSSADLTQDEKLNFGRNRLEFDVLNIGGDVNGQSYGLIVMIASILTARRKYLFTPHDLPQKDIAIVATGVIDKSGKLIRGESGRNVGSLKEKLQAVLNNGNDMFGDYDERYFIMPDQTVSATETELLKQLVKDGWKVKEINNVMDLPFLAAKVEDSGGDDGSKKSNTSKKSSWKMPVTIAVAICAGIAFYSYSLIDTAPDHLPSETALANDLDQGNATMLPYSGSLKLHVQAVRSDRLLPRSAIGQLFEDKDIVQLTFEHIGANAFVVLSRAEMPIDSFKISSADMKRRYLVDDLIGIDHRLLISAATCETPDCSTARAQLLADLPTEPNKILPVGGFNVSNLNGPLKAALVFTTN